MNEEEANEFYKKIKNEKIRWTNWADKDHYVIPYGHDITKTNCGFWEMLVKSIKPTEGEQKQGRSVMMMLSNGFLPDGAGGKWQYFEPSVERIEMTIHEHADSIRDAMNDMLVHGGFRSFSMKNIGENPCKSICICSMNQLMKTGCKCGSI